MEGAHSRRYAAPVGEQAKFSRSIVGMCGGRCSAGFAAPFAPSTHPSNAKKTKVIMISPLRGSRAAPSTHHSNAVVQ